MSFLNVTMVQFNGPIDQSSQQKISADLKGKNILSLSTDQVKTEVNKIANVAAQSIDKKLPDTVVINVGKSEAVLSWQSSKGRFLVDESGKVYAEAGSEQVPQISSPQTNEAVGSKIDDHLVKLLQTLTPNYTVLTGLVDDSSVRVHLSTGQDIIFNTQNDLTSEIQALQLITAKAKIDGRLPRVVDLRFSKPVVSF